MQLGLWVCVPGAFYAFWPTEIGALRPHGFAVDPGKFFPAAAK